MLLNRARDSVTKDIENDELLNVLSVLVFNGKVVF